jgi:hypothetical protein
MIVNEISQNRLKVSHPLGIGSLDEKEQKIINNVIIDEHLTVLGIRKSTRQRE